jgi:hypothetical protein
MRIISEPFGRLAVFTLLLPFMQRLTFIKTCLFRLLAIILLAVSAGFVILPESSIYSSDRTFIKSHAPLADNYMLVLTSDDKEDLDEDGSVDIQFSPLLFNGSMDFVSFDESDKARVKPLTKMKLNQAYILHRQLLI